MPSQPTTLALAAALAFVGLPASAAPARVLGMDDAVALALAQQPELARQLRLREAAAARVDQDRASALPQASLGIIGQLGNPGGSFTLKAPDVQGAGSGEISLGSRLSAPGPFDAGAAVSLGQTVWNPLLAARTRQDRARAAVADAGFTLQAATAIRDVKLAYLEALRTRHRVAIADRIVKDRTLTLSQTQALAKAGLVAGLDVQQADVRARSAQADAILAGNAADAAYSALLLRMGEDPSKVQAFELVDPGARGEAALAAGTPPAAGDNPTLALARAREAAAASEVGVAAAVARPRLSAFLNAGLAPSLGAATFSQPLYGGGLELSAPFYTSGLTEAQVREARARAAAEAEASRAITQGFQQSLAITRLALARDHQRFAVLDAQAGLARRALELARQRYRYRLASFLDVATAETALADVENQRNDAGYALGADLAELAFQTGGDLKRYGR